MVTLFGAVSQYALSGVMCLFRTNSFHDSSDICDTATVQKHHNPVSKILWLYI